MNQNRQLALELAAKLRKENATLYGGSHPALKEAEAMLLDLARLPSPIEVRVTAMTDAAKMAQAIAVDPSKRTEYSVGWNAACETIASALYGFAATDAKLAPPEDQQAAQAA